MRETTWTLRGQPFAALEWGDRDGTPIVFLHGYLDSAGLWEGVAERLDGWRLALDQRGHGRSMHAGPGQTYFFPEYLADLDALLAELGRPVHLVGHSMGGTVATMYAGARPERVVSVASLDGLGLPDGATDTRERLVAFLDGASRTRPHRRFGTLADAALRLRTAVPTLDEAWALRIAERVTEPDGDGVRWRWDPRHRIRGPIPYRQAHHVQLLVALRCPVLSLHPERSPFASADVAALESAIPDLRVVEIPGAGHALHVDAPGLVAEALRAFFPVPST